MFSEISSQDFRRICREEGMRVGRLEGEQLYLIKQVIQRVSHHFSASQIATDLLEPLETIQPIFNLALQQAPNFDAEKILHLLNKGKL